MKMLHCRVEPVQTTHSFCTIVSLQENRLWPRSMHLKISLLYRRTLHAGIAIRQEIVCTGSHNAQSKRPEGLLDFIPKKHGYLRYISIAQTNTKRQSILTSLGYFVRWREPATSTRFDHFCLISLRTRHLSGLGREDVGVTGVDDGHGGATEELTASGTKLDLYYGSQVSQNVAPSKVSVVQAESFFSGL